MKQLLYSKNPWYIRVGLAISMDYHKDEDVLDMVIDAIKKINTKTLESEYYVWFIHSYLPNNFREYNKTKNDIKINKLQFVFVKHLCYTFYTGIKTTSNIIKYCKKIKACYTPLIIEGNVS